MIQRHDHTKKRLYTQADQSECKAKQSNGTSPQFYYSGFVPECQVTERKIVMEIKTATVKVNADGSFKAPEWLKAIEIDLKKYPTFPEALKAKQEADIVEQQGIELYSSNPVQWVFQDLRRRHNGEYSELFNMIDVFNYGYIMGIRAERARRKGGKA